MLGTPLRGDDARRAGVQLAQLGRAEDSRACLPGQRDPLDVTRIDTELEPDSERRERLDEGRVVAREILADGEDVRLSRLGRPRREEALVDPEKHRARPGQAG